MNVANAKQIARAWIEENLPTWPGLRAAHLVGGITAMPDDAPFPPTKDVDIHLVFADDSPALKPGNSFQDLIEVAYDGILIEAGSKPFSDYVDAATVLANPEIAYHLTRDVALYDPSGHLAALADEVRAGYARREFVLARLEHERQGLNRAFALRQMVGAMNGPAAEWNILGYTNTFLTATMQVATLSPPKMGGRTLVNLRDQLASAGRLDLHERVLDNLGLACITVEDAERILAMAAEAFDLALDVKRTPHHFEHKLQRHLRPYFIDSCRGMIAEGYHREGTAWAGAFYAGCTDVILADAPEDLKIRYAAEQSAFIQAVGMDTQAARDARYAEVERLRDEIYALAMDLIARNPAITA